MSPSYAARTVSIVWPTPLSHHPSKGCWEQQASQSHVLPARASTTTDGGGSAANRPAGMAAPPQAWQALPQEPGNCLRLLLIGGESTHVCCCGGRATRQEQCTDPVGIAPISCAPPHVCVGDGPVSHDAGAPLHPAVAVNGGLSGQWGVIKTRGQSPPPNKVPGDVPNNQAIQGAYNWNHFGLSPFTLQVDQGVSRRNLF